MIDVSSFLRSCVAPAAGIMLAATLSGCGSDTMDTASVSGKVTYNGAPVPGGGLTFSPIGDGGGTTGKPASATINPDGTYTLTTYEEGDGAVVGKHNVSFSPPQQPEAPPAPEGAHQPSTPPSPFAGLKPTTPEVEVKDENNVIDIQLTK